MGKNTSGIRLLKKILGYYVLSFIVFIVMLIIIAQTGIVEPTENNRYIAIMIMLFFAVAGSCIPVIFLFIIVCSLDDNMAFWKGGNMARIFGKPNEEKLKRKRERFLAKGIKFWLYRYALVVPVILAVFFAVVLLTPIKIFVEFPRPILIMASTPPLLVGLMSIIPVLVLAYSWLDLTKPDGFDKLSKEKKELFTKPFIKKNFLQLLMASYIGAILSFVIFWSLPEDKVTVASMVVKHGKNAVASMIDDYEKSIRISPPPAPPPPPIFVPPPAQ